MVADQDSLKHEVAARALAFVEPGMRLGLGSGTTAAIFVDLLAERVRSGLDILCVPTSERTRARAAAQAIPLATLDELPELDLTIDGADEFDPALRLVKGGGGALLREKIVAAASRRMVVIADASKAVERLGRFPLPVEVNPFGLGSTRLLVRRAAERCGLSGPIELRAASGEPFVTDGGHRILDCSFGAIPDPEALAAALCAVPGVVEHGLFIGYASTIITSDARGVRVVGLEAVASPTRTPS